MTDTPKPPMVVGTGGHRTGFLATSTEPSDMTPDGPYVHLDQFLEEVEKRAKVIERGLKLTFGSWNQACGIAFKQFTEELKEQNEN